MVSGVTTAVVENLYPTATFEVKITATSKDKNYCIFLSLRIHV